jgi:membrane-associated protease RseP (regulator of RpoE activity)
MSKLTIAGMGCLALLVLCVGSMAEDEEGGERGWIGIRVRNLEVGEAKELGFRRDGGVMIQHVTPESPAAKVGLKEGDILVFVRNVELRDVTSLVGAFAGSRPGEKVGFAAWRKGEMFDGRMTLVGMPGERTEKREAEHGEGAFAEVRQALAETREALRSTEASIEEATEALVRAAEEGKKDRIRSLVGRIRELSHVAAQRRLHLHELEKRLEELEVDRGRERHAPRGERDERKLAERHIEILRVAMKAFMEAEHKGMAETIEHKIHAIELTLKGRRDDEAMKVRETAPGDGRMAELLGHAGRIYREFKMVDRAEWCEELGRHYGERFHAQRARKNEGGGVEDRVHRLEGRIAEMQRALEEIVEELKAIKRER